MKDRPTSSDPNFVAPRVAADMPRTFDATGFFSANLQISNPSNEPFIPFEEERKPLTISSVFAEYDSLLADKLAELYQQGKLQRDRTHGKYGYSGSIRVSEHRSHIRYAALEEISCNVKGLLSKTAIPLEYKVGYYEVDNKHEDTKLRVESDYKEIELTWAGKSREAEWKLLRRLTGDNPLLLFLVQETEDIYPEYETLERTIKISFPNENVLIECRVINPSAYGLGIVYVLGLDGEDMLGVNNTKSTMSSEVEKRINSKNFTKTDVIEMLTDLKNVIHRATPDEE